jgi:hypothetical protein
VNRSGIDQVRDAKLFDVAKTLKPWVGNNVKYQLAFDMNKPVQRIVNDFLFVQQDSRLGTS